MTSKAPKRHSRRRRVRVGGERGSTLVELLIASAIMGTAVVAILTGASATFTSSGANRQSTTGGIVARDYAEALDVVIAQGAWCSTSYTVPASSYSPPAGYSVVAAATPPNVCPSSGSPQVEPVTITVTQPNGSTEVFKTAVRQP
jgi:Tfp pilus assembly protein PilV